MAERTQSTSTTTRQPWGGQLSPDYNLAQNAHTDSLAIFGHFLKKWTELCLLACLVAVPLLYNFSLDVPVLTAIRDWFYHAQNHRAAMATFFDDQLSPFIQGIWPVLESKFSAWFVLGIMMIAGCCVLKIMEAISGRQFLFQYEHVPDSARSRMHRLVPFTAIFIFLILALASLLFWPPQVAPEAQILTGAKGLRPNALGDMAGQLSMLGGGGFFHSIESWMQVVFVVFFFLIAEDLIRERHFVNKIIALIVIMGFFNALIVLFQKIGFEPIVNIMPRWVAEDARNNLGAFIGHNTGVSSFLMAPLLIATMWMVSVQPKRRQLFRMMLLFGIIIMSLAMILAQSRAVLPIVIACSALLIALLYIRSVLLRKSRLYIWLPVALAFVILTQFIPSQYNPLYRRDVTLASRLGEFRQSRLLTETRLRILAVSMTELFPRSPWIGSGWGSFQYVYPEAQGQYFQHNPRSILAPTYKRSFQAHNEYLQTMIETGVVGLFIILSGVGFLLYGGWITFQRTLIPHHIAAQSAIFASIIAYLLHGLVDFPFRVPPLALTLVVLLALWSAGDRLWIFPVRTPVEEDSRAAAARRRAPRAFRFSLQPTGRGLIVGIGFIVCTCAAVGIIKLSASALNRFQSTEVLVVRANAMLELYQRDMEKGQQALVTAFNDAYSARRTLWISGPANRVNAYSGYYRAAQAYQKANELAQRSNFELAAKTRGTAELLARTAINDLNMAFSEERVNSMYQIRSELNRLIGTNSDEDKRRDYMARSFEDLVRAVSMNPGDANAIFALVQTLERDPKSNYSVIVHNLEVLHHFHPQFFDANVFSRVTDAMSLEENRDALNKMQFIVGAVPDNPDYQMAYAATLLRTGNAEAARQIVQKQIPAAEGNKPRRDYLQMMLVDIAIEQKEYSSARKMLQGLASSSNIPPILIKASLLFLPSETDEQNREKTRLREEMEAMGKLDPINYQIVGITAFSTFNNLEEAANWLELRRDAPSPTPPMDLQGNCILAKSYALLNDWDNLGKMLAQMDCTGKNPYASALCHGITNNLIAQYNAAIKTTVDPVTTEKMGL